MYLSTESLQTPCFPLDLHFKILQTLFQLFLLIFQILFHVEQTFFLLKNIALPAGQLQLTAAHFFLFDLSFNLFSLLIHVYKAAFAFCPFQFAPVDFCLCSFFFGPLHQKLLDLAAFYDLVHLLIQPADLLQRIQLFLLTLRQQFVPFIIPDVLLHQLNIGFIRNITDVLRDEFLDIHNWPERNSLFHHPQDLLVVDVPFRKHSVAVLFLGVEKFCPCIVLLQKTAKRRKFHRFALFNKAIFRQCPRVNKECITVASIAAAVKYYTRHKAAALHLILKFAGDIGGKILATTGIRAVIIHVGAQIALQ